MICHGQGDPRADPFDGGCCYVSGEVCPLRWFIDWNGDIGPAGEMYDSTRTSLGTITDYVTDLMPGGGPNKADRVARVVAQVQNATFVCSAAAYVIGMDPSLINDRAQFEAAWEATAEYQAIADLWEAQGKPRNWCMTYGPTEQNGQCCFKEDQATNDARAGALDAVAVTVRSAATGAS